VDGWDEAAFAELAPRLGVAEYRPPGPPPVAAPGRRFPPADDDGEVWRHALRTTAMAAGPPPGQPAEPLVVAEVTEVVRRAMERGNGGRVVAVLRVGGRFATISHEFDDTLGTTLHVGPARGRWAADLDEAIRWGLSDDDRRLLGLDPHDEDAAPVAGRPASAEGSAGYLVADRAVLLHSLAEAGVVPAHPGVVADHVTYRADDPYPAPPAARFTATGWVRSAAVDALVGDVDGRTVRPDGGRFHITLSVAPGHHGRESNDAIAEGPVHPLAAPVPVDLVRF
jgi:hypothetical protein